MKTLYISDMDGTLLGADATLSPRSVEMLNRAIGDGALFSVATARTPSTVSHLLRDVNMNLPAIVMTGAAVWNPAGSPRYLHRVTMPHEVARDVIDVIERHRLPAFIYFLRGDMIEIYHRGPLSAQEQKFIDERAHSPFKRFHIPADGNSELPDALDDLVLCYAMQPSVHTEETYRDMCDVRGVNPLCYKDIYGPEAAILEVFDAGASKANAVRWLKEKTGASRTVVFGDNINDLPMMREADVAVAVENAVREVREAADIIIGPNTHDSVPHAILEGI